MYRRKAGILVVISFFVAIPLFAQQDDLSGVLKGSSRYLQGGAAGISTSIGKDRFNFVSRKGDRVEGYFTVYNRNEFSVIIKIEAVPIALDAKGDTQPVSMASAPPNALARHSRISPNQFPMPAQSQKDVQFSVAVPKDASDGTNYVGFSVQSMVSQVPAKKLKEKELLTASEMGFSPALRVLVAVDVGGASKTEADYDIVNAQVSPEGSQLLVGNITLKAKGGSEIPVTVAAVVLDSTNNVVARLRPEGKVLLKPNEQKNIECRSSAQQLDKGEYKVRFTVLSERAETKTIEKTLVIR